MDHNYSTCGGPRTCTYCLSILSETPEQGVARIAAETAGARMAAAAELRTNVHFEQEDSLMDKDQLGRALQGYGSVQLDPPPDGYASGIERLRTAQKIMVAVIADDDRRVVAMREFRDHFYALTSRMAAAAPATSDVHLSPPDGHSIALAKRKEIV